MGQTKNKPTNTDAVLKQIESLLNNMQEGEAYELALSLDESGEVAVQLIKTVETRASPAKREFGKLKGEIELCDPAEEAAFDQELERLFYEEAE